MFRRVVYALRRLRVCPRSLGTRVGARSLARSLVARYALRRERVYTQTHSHSHSRSHSPLLASARARLAPTKRARTNALGLRENTRCVRDFCERVRVAHAQLAIICERARNVDSRTFETHYKLMPFTMVIPVMGFTKGRSEQAPSLSIILLPRKLTILTATLWLWEEPTPTNCEVYCISCR